MESEELASLFEELDGNIDGLEEALAPLLDKDINETASKLPLLDKAKLHVLVTYAIESLIFCKSSNYYSKEKQLTETTE